MCLASHHLVYKSQLCLLLSIRLRGPPEEVHQGETRGSRVTFEKDRQNKVVGISSASIILDSCPQIIFLLGQVPNFLETVTQTCVQFPPRTILKNSCFFLLLLSCAVIFLPLDEPSLNAGGLQLSCFLRSHCYLV